VVSLYKTILPQFLRQINAIKPKSNLSHKKDEAVPYEKDAAMLRLYGI